jgi:hypothetical protein
MSGAITSLPPCALMAWCSVKAQGQLYLYLYLLPLTIFVKCANYEAPRYVTFFTDFHFFLLDPTLFQVEYLDVETNSLRAQSLTESFMFCSKIRSNNSTDKTVESRLSV